MPQRHSKSERNLEQELDNLIAQIESSVPDLTKHTVVTKINTPAPVANTATPAPLINTPAQADAAPSADHASASPVASADSAPTSDTASTEDMLSAQIQTLLDDVQQQHASGSSLSGKPKAMTGSSASPRTASATAVEPSPIAHETDASITDDFAGDFDSPQDVLAQASLPEPTTVDRSIASNAAASVAATDDKTHVTDDEVSRILEQIDDDLSQQAEEAVAGEFETVQDVVGVPAAASAPDATTSDEAAQPNVAPTTPAEGTSAAQVARELDEQTLQAAGSDADDLSTPIPSIPPDVLAKAAAISPAPPSPAPTTSPAATVAPVAAAKAVTSSNASTKPVKSSFTFKLTLPPLGSTLRAVLTLINGPLLNINPNLRQAVGILGLGNLLLGSMWVVWLLLTRH